MAKKKIYDIDMLSGASPSFDSGFTTSILATNSSAFTALWIAGIGAVVTLLSKKPIKTGIRVGFKFLEALLRTGIDFLLHTKAFFKSLLSGISTFFKGAWKMLVSIWDFMKKMAGILRDVKAILKNNRFNIAMSKLWNNFKKGFQDYTAKIVDKTVKRYNTIVDSINVSVGKIEDNFKQAKKTIETSYTVFKKNFSNILIAIKNFKIKEDLRKLGIATLDFSKKFVSAIVSTIRKGFLSMLSGLKSGLKSLFVNTINAPARKAASSTLNKRYGSLANLDPALKKLLAEANEAIGKTKGWSNIADQRKFYDSVLGFTAGAGRSIKGANAAIRRIEIIPVVGDVAGFIVGSIFDAKELQDKGYGAMHAWSAAIIGNFVGSAVSATIDFFSAGLGVFAVPAWAGSLLIDAWLTDSVIHLFANKHSSTTTLDFYGKSIKSVWAWTVGGLGDLFNSSYISAAAEKLRDVGYVMDINNMSNNMNNYFKLYTSNVFLNLFELPKMLFNADAIPAVIGIQQVITEDGVVVENPDEGDSSDEDTSSAGYDIESVKIPYPGYLYVGFMNNINKIPTKESIGKLKSQYDTWNTWLKSAIDSLTDERDALKTRLAEMRA